MCRQLVCEQGNHFVALWVGSIWIAKSKLWHWKNISEQVNVIWPSKGLTKIDQLTTHSNCFIIDLLIYWFILQIDSNVYDEKFCVIAEQNL